MAVGPKSARSSVKFPTESVTHSHMLIATAAGLQDTLPVPRSQFRTERISLEDALIHVRGKDERVGVAVVSCIVSPDDVPERSLARVRLAALDQRHALPQCAPELSVVLRVLIGVHLEVKLGEKELTKVE